MTPRRRHFLQIPLFALTGSASLLADWHDDSGYTRLQQTYTTGVPDAVAAGVTQAEASNSSGNNYLPAANNTAFSGKTINNLGGGTGSSNHATTVGGYFYGNTNSLIPATTTIDAYNANEWLESAFLNFNTLNPVPLTENRAVQNHSWISIFDRELNSESAISAAVANINQRLDFAIDRDGFSSAVGVNNNLSTTLPDLLCQSFHTISVGRVDGKHSHGLTTHDTAGRMKPDLVAFESLTSFATPQVASAAGLLAQKIQNNFTSGLVTADHPRLTKTLLLAGAAKEPLTAWTRADTTKPYDATFGAGALNILLAYRILDAGNASPSASSIVPATAWSVASANTIPTSQSTRTYIFDVAAGSAGTTFSAALTWHRSGSTLANLNLRLFNVNPGTFTPGSEIDASVSTVDNVEHIYRTALPAGRYALQVTRVAGSSTRYALAWRTSPVVNIAATDATAAELDGDTATFTVTRTGPVTSPLLVPLAWTGTAVSGSHYTTPPDSVLIPAGQTTATVTITPIPDDLAQGDRTITLTVASDYSLTAGDTASDDATIRDKPFDAWRFARFSAPQLADATISGDTADPDADGRANLLEYAFATEPLTVDADTHVPITTLDGALLAVTYLEAAGRDDLTYTVETTTDLTGDWLTGAPHLEETSRATTTAGDEVTVRRVDTAERQFLRLNVTK